VFMDIDNIPLGVDFREHISGEVSRCDLLLALIGDRWLALDGSDKVRRIDSPSDLVRIEIESALNRSIPVVPVLIGGAKMPPKAELPESMQALAFRNAAEVSAGRDARHQLDQLANGLREILELQARRRIESGEESTRLTKTSLRNGSRRQWLMLCGGGASVTIAAVSLFWPRDTIQTPDGTLPPPAPAPAPPPLAAIAHDAASAAAAPAPPAAVEPAPLPAPAAASAPSNLLNQDDPTAIAMGYVEDASLTDGHQNIKKRRGANCSSCLLYQGEPGSFYGGCPLFSGKSVLARGWCSAWALRQPR